MFIASQGGASGVLYGLVRGGQGFISPIENAAAEEAAAKASARLETLAQSKMVTAPPASAPPGQRGDSSGYAAEGSADGARSVKISTVSAMSAFAAAVEEKLQGVPPSTMQKVISSYRGEALETQASPFSVIGPDRGQVGGSGPQKFNSALFKDGVASPDEVLAKSSWHAAHGGPEVAAQAGPEPIGYDGARLSAAPAADRYAAALRATFA